MIYLFLWYIIVTCNGNELVPPEILSRYPGQDDYISTLTTPRLSSPSLIRRLFSKLVVEVLLLQQGYVIFNDSNDYSATNNILKTECQPYTTKGPTTYLEAVAGSSAFLPCNISSPLTNDGPVLVLWYKSGVIKPIYSFDVRSGLPTHWKSDRHLGSRGTFEENKGSLVLERLLPDDQATYRCRVDFKTNPTLTYSVNLTVIVPPRKLWIIRENGKEATAIVGPYREGERVLLTCKVQGGHPTPIVRWKEGTKIIDNIIEKKRSKQVANTLMIARLSRSDLHRALTCAAINTELTAPLQRTVTIDMIFPPLSVQILTTATPLSAGKRYKLECESIGSRPKADMGWTLGGRQLATHSLRSSEDGNVTISTLLWAPRIEDSGQELACRASSPSVEQVLEDSIIVVVYYSPRVALRPGHSLDLANIEEGDDVYFECHIKADPPVYSVIWMLNENVLTHNVTAGIIVSNQSLVLQKIQKSASGRYACQAANIEGKTSSESITLRVKYSPVCRSQQAMLHGAARHEQVRIPCHLDAHPQPDVFYWTFNNSGESVKIPEDHVKSEKYISTVSYTPRTELDYGTLLCWGQNIVGTQRDPCVFHVFAAGRPDPVSNCSQFNLSDTAVNIRCSPGFDGGLQQTFVLELYDNHSSRLVANVTSSFPVLSVSELDAATSFAALIYSTNEKGSGELFRLQTYTLKDNAEKRTAAIKPAPSSNGSVVEEISPLIVIALGVISGVLLVIVVIAATIRIRNQRNPVSRDENEEEKNNSKIHSSTSLAPIIIKETDNHIESSVEKKLSDVIPYHEASNWHEAHVRTISSSSLVGSYATLPRRGSSGANQCQGGSGMQFREFGLVRAPSLHSTCSRHLDISMNNSEFSSTLDRRRLSQPLNIPPPPPQFASSGLLNDSNCEVLWKSNQPKSASIRWVNSHKEFQCCDHGSPSDNRQTNRKCCNRGQHESSV